MACKNCNHVLSEDDKFCNNCGGQVIQNRLTVKNLFTEFHETFFSWEANRPIKTFVNLLRCPENVIGGYIDGVRKKYLNPFGYVAISLTLSGFYYFVVLKFFPGALDMAIDFQGVNEHTLELTDSIQKKVYEYNSFVFFALVPLLALISWIVFYNKKKYNYTEHLIINLYAYSEVSIINILLLLTMIWYNPLFIYSSFIILGFQIIYYSYIFKKLFRLTWLQLVIKTLYLFALIIPIYIGAIILFLLVMLFTGNLDSIIEAAKAENAVAYIASSFKNWTS